MEEFELIERTLKELKEKMREKKQEINSLKDKIKELDEICNYYEKENNEIKNALPSYTESIIQSKNFDSSRDEFQIKKKICIENEINFILALSNYKIAICSEKEVRIFSLKENSTELTLKDNDGNIITCLCELPSGLLVSGGNSRKIKVWEISSGKGQIIQILTEHKDKVKCLRTLSENRFGSSSSDKTINIYSSDTPFRKIAVLKGHDASVLSFIELSDKSFIVSSGAKPDSTLRFWNTSYEEERSIQLKSSCKGNFVEMNKKIIFLSKEEIFIVDINTFKIEKICTQIECKNISCFILCKDEILLCGFKDGHIRAFHTYFKEFFFEKKLENNRVKNLIQLGDDLYCCSIMEIKSFLLFKTTFTE